MLKVVKPIEHQEQESRKPRRKGRWKLWLTLIVLLSAVLSVVFFRSSLSRIQEIEVEGNVYADRSAVIEAAGLRIGGQFFESSATSIEQRIVSNLNAIEHATVEKRFPGKILLTVDEYDPVAYELLRDGSIQALLGSGAEIPLGDQGLPAEKPMLTEWEGKEEEKAKLCRVLASVPDGQLSDLSEIMPAATESFPDKIRIFTRSRFEVETTVSLLKDKLEILGGITETQNPGFINMMDGSYLVPFVESEAESEVTP
ncbi:cell division protein FtsQ/DivIB [Saccharibacillus alkalitolerans]|uniref:FtsQ-type POTRA domain-containing protein n=1 Tax=Saccharibacillus alkalitolerans TaxID=2705290 RepID=A0ABX0EYR1_9BACL|nr:FtsQ-type POTRA domain-containing protein [Saccharibacillus alkalitolerans]NGZ73882.1 FtsQ-type POTRA domain-containing protein [Saccharibacillus alkalitolerans]